VKKNLALVTFGVVLLISGIGYASVTSLAPFEVVESQLTYKYSSGMQCGGGYPACPATHCPCDTNLMTPECGGYFYTDTDYGASCVDTAASIAGIVYNRTATTILDIQSGTVTINGDLTTSGTIVGSGSAFIYTIPTGGTANTLCASASNGGRIERCGSSRTLKDNIKDLNMGLSTVEKLHPVLFNWKENGQRDFGFIAEEVADVSPVLAIYNEKGEPDGVKYMNMSAVLAKAVQEQQALITSQQAQISELKMVISEITGRLAMLESSAKKTVASK